MTPDDSDEVRVQKAVLTVALLCVGIPAQAMLGAVAIYFQEYPMAVVVCTSCLFCLGVLILFARVPSTYSLYKATILGSTIIAPLLCTLVTGGLLNTAFAMLWAFAMPLLALVLYRPRQAICWFFAYLGAVAICGLAQPFMRSRTNIPAGLTLLIGYGTLIGVSIMIFAALMFFVSQRDRAYRLLRMEQDKSEALLLNILPAEIAEILKDRGEVIASEFEGASILFADVVGFTPMSATMRAAELVGILNEVFSCFDVLVEKYRLEKIKTIGDCYMVASGVPRPDPRHAHVLVRMALELCDQVRHRTFRGRPLHFRIGINSGPVVAGVIGRKKFIYDLWGDAVNTASRMESHGRGNVIQITAATHELIKDEFQCQSGGVIDVKGKGPMEVWWVVGPK